MPRFGTGSLVRLGRGGEPFSVREFGVVLKEGPDNLRVMLNGGIAEIEPDHASRTPERLGEWVPMRLHLPWGFWKTSSNSHVLFSRDEMPLWEIIDGEAPKPLAPWVGVDAVEEGFYWADGQAPWERPLSLKRIRELFRLLDMESRQVPPLVWAIGPMVRFGFDKIEDAVAAMVPKGTRPRAALMPAWRRVCAMRNRQD